MHVNRTIVAALAVTVAVGGWVVSGAAQQQLPLQPTKERGANITAAYEGWYPNPDGTFTLLIGYFNRNRAQTIDIPIGPNNQIQPGGPDYNQPTHFLPRRQWGVFTIVVPKDFGTKKLVWTIVANGEKTEIPFSLTTSYQVSPFKDVAMGNTPPVLKLQENGPEFTGPPRGFAATLSATVGQPLTFPVWVSDKGSTEEGGRGRGSAPATLNLVLHRGPADVKFEEQRPRPDFAAGGKATVSATFSAPGEYVIRVQSNDSSGEGGGGFQCCWTNVHVKVNVK